MNIKVTIKSVYGVEHIYPACERSKLIAAMLGQKTLTSTNVQYLKQIGFTIEVVSNNPKTL